MSNYKLYKQEGKNRRGSNQAGVKNPHYRHGMTGTTIYTAWKNMLSRCYNKKLNGYARYGGRGIAVCDRWRTSSSNFIEDMLPTYKKGLTIERIDNDGNYCPENCKWATTKEQANNKTKGGGRKSMSIFLVKYQYAVEYPSIRDAERVTGLNKRSIKRYLSNECKPKDGSQWRFK